MFKVIHKESGTIYDVYDITYDPINGNPRFLVYASERWLDVNAKEFEPYVDKKKKLFESNLKNKDYKFEDGV